MEYSVMRRHGGNHVGRLGRRDQSGAAMVEFALVVGLFAFILYGLVSFGAALAAKQKVTAAAADGARAAVGAQVLSNGIDGAVEKAQQRVIVKLGTTGYTATYLAEPSCVAPAECIRVTIVYTLPPSPGLGLVTPPSTTSSAVVQYK